MERIKTADERGDIGEFNPGAKLYRLDEAIPTPGGKSWEHVVFVPGEGPLSFGIGIFATSADGEDGELLFEAPDDRGGYLILMDRYVHPEREPVWIDGEGGKRDV